MKEESLALSKGDNTKSLSLEKGVNNATVGTTLKDKKTDTVPRSPHRRKVLKTRIDERGREGIIMIHFPEIVDISSSWRLFHLFPTY